MGWRLSFGVGPFRYSAPLFPKRRRRRRPSRSAGPRPVARTYQGSARFENGATWECSHGHRTPQAADCAQRYTRDLYAGKLVEHPVMPADTCWWCGAPRRQHDEFGNHPVPLVMTAPYPWK
jgi:hypothetical protein